MPTPSGAEAARTLDLVRQRLFGSTPRFGRYRVLRTIGTGAMGQVYEAEDPQLARRVALKVVKLADVEPSEAARERLLREAQALARLSHPNVVPVYDVGNLDGDVFLAMEYVEGGTLSEWLAEQPRSWREIVRVFVHAGRGLAAAHATGLVHRDFKPGNVLVGRDGRVRVADFGLARPASRHERRSEPTEPGPDDTAAVLDARITQTGTVVGTPPYMAPEQHRGASPRPRSDQYAFCVALYGALYGARPFVGDTLDALLRAKLEGLPERAPSRSQPTEATDRAPTEPVPGWVYRVLRRGLEPDPDQRWSSMEDLIARFSDVSAGRYDLVRRLARGGMADLFIARASGIEDFRKYVVLKRILPHLADDAKLLRMFVDEARLAATLDHPNIVTVHDIGKDGDHHFFTMEYVHGEDLDSILRRLRDDGRRLPVAHAVTIAVGACAGLHHAHERKGWDGKPLGIVHRDVSPTNVLVSFEGAVKVTDFGIARIAARSRVTEAGTRKGKAAYMSPEQCQGEALDRRSDVFALGILLYEMTTGTRPFDGDDELVVMRKIVDRGAAPPSSLVDDYDPELERIVMRALAHRASDRFDSARALERAIERWARSQGLSPSPAGLADFMRETFGDKPLPWATGATGATEPAGSEADLGSPLALRPPPPEGVPTPPRPRSARGPWRLSLVAVATLGLGVGLGAWLREAPPPDVRPAASGHSGDRPAPASEADELGAAGADTGRSTPAAPARPVDAAGGSVPSPPDGSPEPATPPAEPSLAPAEGSTPEAAPPPSSPSNASSRPKSRRKPRRQDPSTPTTKTGPDRGHTGFFPS